MNTATIDQTLDTPPCWLTEVPEVEHFSGLEERAKLPKDTEHSVKDRTDEILSLLTGESTLVIPEDLRITELTVQANHFEMMYGTSSKHEILITYTLREEGQDNTYTVGMHYGSSINDGMYLPAAVAADLKKRFTPRLTTKTGEPTEHMGVKGIWKSIEFSYNNKKPETIAEEFIPEFPKHRIIYPTTDSWLSEEEKRRNAQLNAEPGSIQEIQAKDAINRLNVNYRMRQDYISQERCRTRDMLKP